VHCQIKVVESAIKFEMLYSKENFGATINCLNFDGIEFQVLRVGKSPSHNPVIK
jgi:hypothetical protein